MSNLLGTKYPNTRLRLFASNVHMHVYQFTYSQIPQYHLMVRVARRLCRWILFFLPDFLERKIYFCWQGSKVTNLHADSFLSLRKFWTLTGRKGRKMSLSFREFLKQHSRWEMKKRGQHMTSVFKTFSVVRLCEKSAGTPQATTTRPTNLLEHTSTFQPWHHSGGVAGCFPFIGW